eukprot:TRINITY_DN3773_c4_g1_i1.p1 TRINITY_DN3773_c4_g1~~TRINITY_DN3773_c4_g1_i1.p1  ORF type:complete len:347 (+),score=81.72 TRINITY_DN3773_c4_g1_i1:126-1166(+)
MSRRGASQIAPAVVRGSVLRVWMGGGTISAGWPLCNVDGGWWTCVVLRVKDKSEETYEVLWTDYGIYDVIQIEKKMFNAQNHNSWMMLPKEQDPNLLENLMKKYPRETSADVNDVDSEEQEEDDNKTETTENSDDDEEEEEEEEEQESEEQSEEKKPIVQPAKKLKLATQTVKHVVKPPTPVFNQSRYWTTFDPSWLDSTGEPLVALLLKVGTSVSTKSENLDRIITARNEWMKLLIEEYKACNKKGGAATTVKAMKENRLRWQNTGNMSQSFQSLCKSFEAFCYIATKADPLVAAWLQLAVYLTTCCATCGIPDPSMYNKLQIKIKDYRKGGAYKTASGEKKRKR